MPLAEKTDDFSEFKDDLEALLRLQAILLQAAEGARGERLDKEYQWLRRVLLLDHAYIDLVPKFVDKHRDLGSLWPAFKAFSPRWEPRRQEVRRQFEPILAQAERSTLNDSILLGDQVEAEVIKHPRYDPTAWTGAATPTERIAAVKTLLPVAQSAVAQLLASLEAPGHNGGPKLDETEEAIKELRQLHSALGQLLLAADEGRLTDAFNDGLATEAARFAKRAAKALRNDPIPYALSGTVLAILSACSFPGIGGFLSAVALSMKKRGE